VAIDPSDHDVLYLTNVGGLYRSADRGRTWSRVSSPPANAPLSVDARTPSLLYAGAARSEDGGATWQPFVVPQPGNGPCGSSCLFTTARGAVADPVVPRRVYLFTETRCIGFCPVLLGLLRSDDAGHTFVGVSAAGSIVVDPSTQDLYVAGGGAVTVFRGSDLTQPEILSVPETKGIALDPTTGSLFLALADSTIIQSTDGARTWTTVIVLPAPPVLMTASIGGVLHLTEPSNFSQSFAFHFDNSGQVVYGTAFGGYYTVARQAALGSNGHLYLVGYTGGGMPLRNPWQANFGGLTDVFLAEFDAAGILLNSTYIGGLSSEDVFGLFPQDDGSVIVTGYSYSKEFYSKLAPSALGGGNYFILRFRPNP
jgi:hypothetical protein